MNSNKKSEELDNASTAPNSDTVKSASVPHQYYFTPVQELINLKNELRSSRRQNEKLLKRAIIGKDLSRFWRT